MAIIKSYTDISQSKKLAKFLPLESADMVYIWHTTRFDKDMPPMVLGDVPINKIYADTLPCWSLAALLNALPKTINNETLFIETSPALWHIGYRNVYTARADNPVDACVEMIMRLNELNLL